MMKRKIYAIQDTGHVPEDGSGGHAGKKTPRFFRTAPFFLAAACALAVPCALCEEEVSEKPDVSVSLNGWETVCFPRKSPSSGGKEFSLSLKITEQSSWKAGWCEEDGVKVTLADSEGSSPSDIKFDYFSMRKFQPGDRTGLFIVSPESWLPSAGAKWVEVKGTVPLVMFMDSGVTGSVALKLVKGDAVSLLLKGGGMDGGDVQTELSVDEYREESEGKGRSWTVFKLKSPSRVGIQGLEVLDRDGTPVDVERRGDVDQHSGEGYEWLCHMILDQGKGEELNLSVSYMAGFRKITVPVSVRFGLSGTEGKKDVP